MAVIVSAGSGRVRAAATARALALLHAPQDRLPALLQLAEREAVHVGGQAEAGLDGVDVDGGLRGIDADVAHDLLAVVLREVEVHLGDLGEDVDVRREGRGWAGWGDRGL